MNAQFKYGADPEIFVKHKGKPVSAHGLVPGTKKEPFKADGGAYQVDGMALEFNIDPTLQHDFEGFNANIVKVMAGLKAKAREMLPDCNFAIEPVMEFGEEMLAAQPDEAKELGCDPDFNAYTMEENPRPDGDRPFRTAAGHVHVGWGADIPVENEEHREICASFVKMLDATVGMFMTFIDRNPLRRELYGKAGAFRAKPYGVEYRTPSNVWLKNRNRRLIVHTLMGKAISYMTSGYSPDRLHGGNVNEAEIQRIINEGDWKTAKMLLAKIVSVYEPAGKAWTAVQKEMADG